MTQGKRLLQELEDLGLSLQSLRTVPAHEIFRKLVAGNGRPESIVGSRDMLDLEGKGPHSFVFASLNFQARRSEVEFIFRHGFRSFQNELFDGVDLAIHG